MIGDLQRLARNELFGTLAKRELSRLAPICTDFVAVEDALIFREGSNAAHLYLVSEGQVALQKAVRVAHATRSRRTTVDICHPGDLLGWSGLVEPHKYTLSAVAWGSCRLISVDAKMLRRALGLYPGIGYKVMCSLSQVMARRLRQTTDALTSEREISSLSPAPASG